MDDLQKRVLELKARVAAFLADQDCDDLGIALVDLGLEMEAARFRLPPSPGDGKRLMRHPSVTSDTLARYAVDEEGIAHILRILSLAGTKYLDHQAMADVADLVEADQKADVDGAAGCAATAAEGLFEQADALGVSHYGVLTVLILEAVLAGRRYGVGEAAISRILLDMLEIIHRPPPSPSLVDDGMIATALARHLGVSLGIARKYVRDARNEPESG